MYIIPAYHMESNESVIGCVTICMQDTTDENLMSEIPCK
jgi:hypothetical protein